MGMRKFWSVALPFGKVAYAVKVCFGGGGSSSSFGVPIRASLIS